MNAVLIIDKPSGFTSHDVVARVRRILHERSVGHLGTLDPMATGVLPLVIGNMTRLAQFYLKSEKSYEGMIRFGFATDTYDAEGEPTGAPQPASLTLEQVRQLATKFSGIIDQMPPPFSAKKVAGVPAYKLARKKKDVALSSVQVEIKSFEILSIEDDRASFRAQVASGTYMRSVAHDMGQLAGCGAHLQSLRRTAVAEFSLEDAHSLEELERAAHNLKAFERAGCRQAEDRGGNSESGNREKNNLHDNDREQTDESFNPIDALFVHPRKLLPSLPAVTANDEMLARIRHGRPVNLPELSRAREVKVFSGQRDLIAICTRVAGTLFHSKIVLL